MWQEHICLMKETMDYITSFVAFIRLTSVRFYHFIISIMQTVVKKDMKKEEAEELKAKLEAVGATIEIV